MKKVELSVFKPWIYKRVTEIIGLEDEVVIEYVNEQLEQSGKSASIFSNPWFHFALLMFALMA